MHALFQHFRGNIVAYAALLLALSPAAYAGSLALLPANSVGSRQVIDHSLRQVDFKAGVLPHEKAPRVKVATSDAPPGQAAAETTIGCGRGHYATGGGTTLGSNLTLLVSAPAILSFGEPLLAPNGAKPNAWTVRVHNSGASAGRYSVFVVCSR
jgi:hypothetical protein